MFHTCPVCSQTYSAPAATLAPLASAPSAKHEASDQRFTMKFLVNHCYQASLLFSYVQLIIDQCYWSVLLTRPCGLKSTSKCACCTSLVDHCSSFFSTTGDHPESAAIGSVGSSAKVAAIPRGSELTLDHLVQQVKSCKWFIIIVNHCESLLTMIVGH